MKLDGLAPVVSSFDAFIPGLTPGLFCVGG